MEHKLSLDDQLINEVINVIPNELENENTPDDELDILLARFNSGVLVPIRSSEVRVLFQKQ